MALFETKGILPPSLSGGKLEGFERVIYNDKFEEIFKKLLSAQDEVLYNHSPIYPFAYLNTGEKRLFVKSNSLDIFPVVQSNFTTPTFDIYSPSTTNSYELLCYVNRLDKISKDPVTITDVTETFAKWYTGFYPEWQIVRTSLDVIHNTAKLTSLIGRNYSSIRNTLRRVEKESTLEGKVLSKDNYQDALKVFRNWQESQGKKYFRVTIGRDLRLMILCCNKVDLRNYFGWIYYIQGEPKAVSFGCRSWSKDDWGIDVTCKADISCKGLSDYAFHHLVTYMGSYGIKFINDSGYNTPGNKINKLKWFGGKEPQLIPMYDLRRK